MYVGLIVVAAMILLNAFFVAGEFAIAAVERSRVERRAEAGDPAARRVLASLHNLSFQLSGAQLGITATSLIVGAIAEPAIGRLIDPLVARLPWIPEGSSLGVSVVLALVLATGVQMVIGELVPKNLAVARPERMAVLFGIPLQVVNRLLRPLILLLNNSANWTVRRLGIEPREELAGVRSMEELELMIRSSAEQGRLDDDELRLLARAISFTEKVAADAMIPRVAVVGISRHDSVAHLRQLARQTGHSRFPVYGEDLDEVDGVVHVKDSFAVPAERRPLTPVAVIGRPVLKVPETRPLDELLTDLQSQGRRMAVVIDEYGGTAGIVTVEDLVEEIFGEIADEYDADLPPESPAGEGEVLSGLLHRHEVEELTGFEWPEGRYETLGGLLVARLGRFPRPGEVVAIDRWAFEVLEMEGHRIARVRVRRPSAEPSGEAEA
ncbi:MAG: HlyC/CorC family transporter [Acidimicrobiia bacterium]|nr:HlyC/CorC family transporter [Acidimicrobiia bacterium]